MVLSSVMVATVAGQALAADPQILRHTQEMAAQLPMFDISQLDTSRGGIGSGLLNDTDVNQGSVAWNFDSNFNFVTAAFVETVPDLSTINGGQINGGTSSYSGGSFLQEATHTYIGYDATNDYHVHSYEFTVEDSTGDFLPTGSTLSGTPINFISSEMGTNNLGGNGMTFDGEVLGFFSASMDVYVGGNVATTSDFFDTAASNLSFAGTSNEGGAVNYNDSIALQGFNPFVGNIAGFGIEKLVMRGQVAVAVPTPGSLALLGMAGLAGVRRRR